MVEILSHKAIIRSKDFNFVDMHHHSNVSDGRKTPEQLYKKFKKKRLGLCLTDHNQIKGSVFLCKQKDIFSIPSIEVTSKESKDFLAYFYDINDLISFYNKEIKTNIIKKILPLHETKISNFDIIDKVESYNGIPILAHPFGLIPKRSAHLLFDKEFVKKIKGIESHNFSIGEYERTLNFVLQFNKPLIAGTDDHNRPHFSCLTGTRYYDIENFLKAILKKENIIYTKKLNRIRKLKEWMNTFRNNVF
jgi:histidinol phosphatase-like PHP family hydrolase